MFPFSWLSILPKYLYFVVGYCFAYVLLLAVSSIRLAKDGQSSRAVHRMVRLVVFGLCAAGAMVLLLLPMVRKILSFDYAGRYSYYNFGGITLELAAQTLRIGLLNFILIGMGLWFAAKRRLPALPCPPYGSNAVGCRKCNVSEAASCACTCRM